MQKTLNSEQYFNSILNSVADGVLSLDINGNIVDANKSLLDMFGYEVADIVSQNIAILMPENVDDVLSLLSTTSSNFSSIKKLSICAKRKDKSDIYIELKVSSIKKKQEDVALLIAVINDVTDQKNTKDEAERAMLAVLDAEKAKSLFVNNISHELRTPIHGISGLLQLIANEVVSKQGHEYVLQIWNKTTELISVVDMLLDFSQATTENLALNLMPFQPEKLVDSFLESYEEMASNKAIDLNVTTYSCENIWLLGDAQHLTRAITLLIDNAIKFTLKGGVNVYITAQINALNQKVDLTVNVKDSGIGISHSNLELIFKPFWQVERTRQRNFGGTGLGLSLCELVLNEMNSHLEVISTLNEGSEFSFTVTLPTTSEPDEDINADNETEEVAEVESDNVDLFQDDDCLLFGDDEEEVHDKNPLDEIDLPAVDLVQLQQLKDSLDVAVVTNLINTFFDDVLSKLDELEIKNIEGDQSLVLPYLEAIQSSSMSAGADELQAMVTTCLKLFKDNLPSDIEYEIDTLKQAVTRYKENVFKLL